MSSWAFEGNEFQILNDLTNGDDFPTNSLLSQYESLDAGIKSSLHKSDFFLNSVEKLLSNPTSRMMIPYRKWLLFLLLVLEPSQKDLISILEQPGNDVGMDARKEIELLFKKWRFLVGPNESKKTNDLYFLWNGKMNVEFERLLYSMNCHFQCPSNICYSAGCIFPITGKISEDDFLKNMVEYDPNFVNASQELDITFQHKQVHDYLEMDYHSDSYIRERQTE